MTCIIAFKHKKDQIVMAGDKMGSDTYTSMTAKEPKVFWNGDFRIGYAGSFRMGQLLKHIWSAPERKVGQLTDNYLYRDVIPSFKLCFDDNGFGNPEKGDYGSFLMCYKDRILEVQEDLSILEHETDIVSVGSGSYHATAALQVLLEYEKDVDKILKKTFEVVSKNVVSVSQKFDYLLQEPEKK